MMTRSHNNVLAVYLCVLVHTSAWQPHSAFTFSNHFSERKKSWDRTSRRSLTGRATQQQDGLSTSVSAQAEEPQENSMSQAVRAPLKFVGPYPCLALRFPNLATANQRERNMTGISLDFVLDTAANVNTMQEQVAKELDLPIVGQALPGVGSAGVIAQGGNTYKLGDAELEGLMRGENEEPFTFMSELTASALPVSNPGSAGLLSLAFLQVFEGGVDFSWGSDNADRPASVTFYGDKSMDECLLKDRTMIPIERVPVTQLPTVEVVINGVEMPALLDTGSPITVLNAQAARAAGLETVLPVESQGSNPLKVFSNRFQQAQAASRGEILMVAGTDGQSRSLIKTKDAATVDIGSASFGAAPLFVGELPGLAALNGLGVKSPPAVVLGMDVLRQRPSMLLRAQDNEVWFK